MSHINENRIKKEVIAWIKKYFIRLVDEIGSLEWIIKGKKAIILISRPSQIVIIFLAEIVTMIPKKIMERNRR